VRLGRFFPGFRRPRANAHLRLSMRVENVSNDSHNCQGSKETRRLPMTRFVLLGAVALLLALTIMMPTLRVWRRYGTWPVVFRRDADPFQRLMGASMSLLIAGVLAWAGWLSRSVHWSSSWPRSQWERPGGFASTIGQRASSPRVPSRRCEAPFFRDCFSSLHRGVRLHWAGQFVSSRIEGEQP